MMWARAFAGLLGVASQPDRVLEVGGVLDGERPVGECVAGVGGLLPLVGIEVAGLLAAAVDQFTCQEAADDDPVVVQPVEGSAGDRRPAHLQVFGGPHGAVVVGVVGLDEPAAEIGEADVGVRHLPHGCGDDGAARVGVGDERPFHLHRRVDGEVGEWVAAVAELQLVTEGELADLSGHVDGRPCWLRFLVWPCGDWGESPPPSGRPPRAPDTCGGSCPGWGAENGTWVLKMSS